LKKSESSSKDVETLEIHSSPSQTTKSTKKEQRNTETERTPSPNTSLPVFNHQKKLSINHHTQNKSPTPHNHNHHIQTTTFNHQKTHHS
jgi:hypothetical protein